MTWSTLKAFRSWDSIFQLGISRTFLACFFSISSYNYWINLLYFIGTSLRLFGPYYFSQVKLRKAEETFFLFFFIFPFYPDIHSFSLFQWLTRGFPLCTINKKQGPLRTFIINRVWVSEQSHSAYTQYKQRITLCTLKFSRVSPNT